MKTVIENDLYAKPKILYFESDPGVNPYLWIGCGDECYMMITDRRKLLSLARAIIDREHQPDRLG